MKKQTIQTLIIATIIASSLLTNISYGFHIATLYAGTHQGVALEYAYFHLNNAPYIEDATNVTQKASNSIGCLHFDYYHVLQLQELNPNIDSVDAATWTITYRGYANVTNKARFCIWWGILSEDMKLMWLSESCPPINAWDEIPDFEFVYATNASCQAYSSLIQTTNQSLIGTYTLSTDVEVDPTDYLIVEWGENKTDTTWLLTRLYFDAQGSYYPTKISGFRYGLGLFTGALEPIWYIVLPIIYLIGVSLIFVTQRQSVSVKGIILAAVGFIVVTIVVPIALNLLYSV